MEKNVEYENNDDMEETLVESDDVVRILNSPEVVVQPSSKVQTSGACNIRRKIEDYLDQKRYREDFDDFVSVGG